MIETAKSSKIGLIFIVAVFSCISALFLFLFFNCISFYSSLDIEYSDLIYEELTFRKYEKIYGYKSGIMYVVYFEEYEKPFEINNISNKKLDKTSLENLIKGESIKVFYKENSSKKYDYEICEFSHDDIVLLSLTDYVETNQKNQITGMIVCPILVIMGLFLDCIFIYIFKSNEVSKKSKEKLGKIKIKYVDEENIIQIYNSPYVCSLVINGKVVDQQFGVIASLFCLNGSVKKEGEIIPVEARMGYFYMRLYVDGKCIGKAFMGFG